MKRFINYAIGTVLLLFAGYFQVAAADNPNPGVLPIQSNPYGMTYGEWGEEFNKWLWQFSLEELPLIQGDGEVDCTAGQYNHVLFLAGALFGTVQRSCTIPPGRAIFISLNAVLSFVPDYGADEQEVREDAKRDLDGTETTTGVEELQVQIDGVDLVNPFNYRAASPEGGFIFTIQEGSVLTVIDPPFLAGDYDPAIVDGYWLMLVPLSVGEHTIHWFSSGQNQLGENYDYDVTWIITVGE